VDPGAASVHWLLRAPVGLSAVSGTSATSAWAVGSIGGGRSGPALERKSLVTHNPARRSDTYLTAVKAISLNNAWPSGRSQRHR